MSKPVIHLTGTQCDRKRNAAEDLNVADTDEQVTCKLCLRRMAMWKRTLTAA